MDEKFVIEWMEFLMVRYVLLLVIVLKMIDEVNHELNLLLILQVVMMDLICNLI
jgi:hypothetical protein